MPIKVNEHLVHYKRDTYAQLDSDPSTLVDCSLGVNPYGPPPGLALPDPAQLLAQYPAGAPTLQAAVVEHWAPVAPLAPESVQLEAGTFGTIERLSKLLIAPGDRVLGFTPQFSDFEHEITQRGAHYVGVPTSPLTNHRFDAEALVRQITPDFKLVYVDNPNNPTGQAIPLPALRSIAAAASAAGVAVLIDEAYGDFLEDSQSGIALVTEFDNIVVARSFSKAWGLAGLRVGYAVLSAPLVPLWSRVAHPFPVNALGEAVAAQALAHTDYLEQCVARVRDHKSRIIAAAHRFTVAFTSPPTPILTLIHPSAGVDLYTELLKHGVLTTSGEHFSGLDARAVRIRIPREIDELITAIRAVGESA